MSLKSQFTLFICLCNSVFTLVTETVYQRLSCPAFNTKFFRRNSRNRQCEKFTNTSAHVAFTQLIVHFSLIVDTRDCRCLCANNRPSKNLVQVPTRPHANHKTLTPLTTVSRLVHLRF